MSSSVDIFVGNGVVASYLIALLTLFVALRSLYFYCNAKNVSDRKLQQVKELVGHIDKKNTRKILEFVDELKPEIYRDSFDLVDFYSKCLFESHCLLSSCVNNTRIDHIIVFYGHSLSILTINVMLAMTLYHPSNTNVRCEDYVDEISCVDDFVSESWFRTCQWDYPNNRCLRAQLLQGKIQDSLIKIFAVALIVILISSIVQTLLEYLTFELEISRKSQLTSPFAWKIIMRRMMTKLKQRRIHIDDNATTSGDDVEEGKIAHDVVKIDPYEYNDEFVLLQSKRTTLLRAVRCFLMHKLIDYLPPKREVDELLAAPRVQRWTQKPDAYDGRINICNYWKFQFKSFRFYYYSVANPEVAYNFINLARVHRKDLILHRIRYSRQRAEEMRKSLVDETLNDYDRDLMLMRFFFIDWYSGCDSMIANNVMFEEPYKKVRLPTKIPWIPFWSVVFLIFGQIGAVVYFSFQIDNSVVDFFLLSTLFSFLTYTFAILPLRILLLKLFIPQIIRSSFLQLFKIFRLRVRRILVKDRGHLSNIHAFIQHFHPACRVARLFPYLPTSRVLMTMHDFDLPKATIEKWQPKYFITSSDTGSPLVYDFLAVCWNNTAVRFTYAACRVLHYISMLCKLILHGFMRIPLDSRGIVMELLVIVTVYGLLLLVTILWVESFPLAIALMTLFAIAVLSIIVHSFQWYWWYKYLRILWDNDFFAPKRTYKLRKKRKSKITLQKV